MIYPSMDNVDPDVPAQKRPRLDSITPAYNGLPPPPQPPQTQSARHPTTHPTSVQASSSPPQSRHYPPHSLPPPQQPYPPPPPSQGQAHYPGTQPSPSLPPSDIRAYSDPRTIPSPGQRTHGVTGPPVTLPARSHSQDSMSVYRPPPTPHSASAPDLQSSRSNSVSLDTKNYPPPGMEHGSHPNQWPVNPEHRHNGSIPNGYNPTISPPAPSEHYPPPSLPPGQQYAQPVASYPTPGPYMGPYAGPGQQVRRKQVRATQACNHCRARKQKCDEARPCQFCRENNFDCQYKDVPPPKQDRSMMQLQDSVNNISDTLRNFVDGFNSWKQSVESRLPASRGHDISMASSHTSPEHGFGAGVSMRETNGSRMPTPVQSRGQLHRVNSMKTESPIVTHSNMSPQASTPIKQETILAAPQPPATPAESVRTERSNATGDNSKKKNGLQSDHTTPAHKLLEEWPSMASFCAKIETLQRLKDNGHSVSDYPMQLEQDRGLIRVWGVGEGQDLNDGAQGPGSPDSSNDSEPFSPAPAKEGIWGCPPLDHSSPSTMSGGTPSDAHYQGGLGQDGRPNFHSSTLWRLHESYRKNIHSLHPFLNPSKLRRMIKEFSETYSPDVKSTIVTSPGSNQLNPGVKRKRSNNAFGEPYSPATDLSRGGIERSLRNAIVLLVLALGKVCEYKNALPAPQSDKSPIANGAWGYHRESPHANSSFSSEEETRPRNIDILPGMAYFSYATDILGNQQGGNTVAHCQAMILAALYLGQFARVLESWSWINNACRICQVLIKADMPKLDRKNYFVGGDDHVSPKEKYRLNLVMCAYWTCLQLESDILAEMSTLPPSGLSEKQDSIAYPSGVYEKFPSEAMEYKENSEDDQTMWIYSSQIYLRVILNDAHNTLYGATGKKKPPGFDINDVNEVTRAARVHRDILETWRKLLPPKLSWQDDQPPSTDINIARLRAKYYGGLYMILRPYLHIANHDIVLPPAGPASAWSTQADSPTGEMSATATPSYKAMHGGLVDLTPSQQEILDLAYECIESAIQSTIAFDRVGADPNSAYIPYKSTRTQRLIVTNIFGTLHAQFGNMLVLAAVYKSRLRGYLPQQCNLNRKNLLDLFDRTIKVLGEVAPNSPILFMDLEILYNVKRQMELE